MDVFASQAGSDQPLLPPEGEKARVGGQCLGTFFVLSKAEVAKRCLPSRMSAQVDHDPSCGRTDRRGDLHHRSVDSCAVTIWPISLASKAGRTRPPVIFGWPGPVVLIFVTAKFEPGTNFLPEIRVGRVVASVGDPSLETSLPFGRRDLRPLRSGRAPVVRIDAVGGPPHGDFTFEDGVRGTTLRRPKELSAVAAGVMSNVVGEVGDQLGSLDQVVPPVGMIVDGLGNAR